VWVQQNRRRALSPGAAPCGGDCTQRQQNRHGCPTVQIFSQATNAWDFQRFPRIERAAADFRVGRHTGC
jgi:hypothetical protein